MHFRTGEPIAKVSQANGGIIQRDMRKAHQAREILCEIPISELIERVKKAADLYENATLPIGDGTQSPDRFCPPAVGFDRSARTHVSGEHEQELVRADAHGPDPGLPDAWFGPEHPDPRLRHGAAWRGGQLSGAVSGSGRRACRPIRPASIRCGCRPFRCSWDWSSSRARRNRGLRIAWWRHLSRRAFRGRYSGSTRAVRTPVRLLLAAAPRAMIFGGLPTVQQYQGNPRVQAHGPGFSKILLGDDVVDQWEKYIDLMADSIYLNSGRGCINCSGIWASRHTQEIAQALAERLGPIEALPPEDASAGLAAFTVPGMAKAVWQMIEADLKVEGVTDVTAPYGPRLVQLERCAYLRPMIVHCESPDTEVAGREYMFPFSTVVQCPQDQMLGKIGPTLVCTAITRDQSFVRQLNNAVHIDRLNVGPIPTTKLNWLQPHEGNIIEFLFRSRAYQVTDEQFAGVS